MSEVDKLSSRRRWLLVLTGVSFLVWQASQFEIAGRADGALEGLLVILGAVAALVWIGALIALLLGFRQRRLGAPVQAALNDELVRA
ncbi:MAG: hypothetical protein WA989_05830, partial [Henriciella sp.]|uniref:hypothetical protein n=1 Tax=Henriciella sp. TaxID=1968823 RepID=UPI003C74B1FA